MGTEIVWYAFTVASHIRNLLRYRVLDPAEFFVFKEKKVIYLVNSKVAQTAISNTCGNAVKKEYSGIAERHLGEKMYRISPAYRNYPIFTFVRNPFDRLYSCYTSKYIADVEKYGKTRRAFDQYLFGVLRNNVGFGHFVKRVAHIPDVLADRHFKAQYYLIYRDNTLPVSYIGRFEHLQDDFEHIRTQYDLEPIQHMNPSRKAGDDWRDAYTLELADIVYHRYKNDFDTWYPDEYEKLKCYLGTKSA